MRASGDLAVHPGRQQSSSPQRRDSGDVGEPDPARSPLSRILAIDPGPVQSAWLYLVSGRPYTNGFGIHPNDQLLGWLRSLPGDTTVVIEEIASYGMAVGREVFETVRWAGRFEEAARPVPVVLLPRLAVKQHLCHDSRAKDANIRQALLDRFGPQGTKREPGVLHGISKDVWSALAIAVTYSDSLR